MRNLLMVCLLALGAGTGFAQEQAETFTARLFTAKGTVECLKAGSAAWLTVKAPYMLEVGDQVRTGLKSKAEIYIRYGSKVRLGEETTFVLNKVSSGENVVEVMRGRMTAWIRKLAGRGFSVRTPAAVCAVRGTTLGVVVSEIGQTATWDLYEGSMQVVDNRNRAVDMTPNQRLSVSQAEGAAAPVALPSDVKVPSEPSRIKEEKAEIKAEQVILENKAGGEAAAAKPAEEKKEELKEEPPAPAEEPVVLSVEEPASSVIPSQEVLESEEVSRSTP